VGTIEDWAYAIAFIAQMDPDSSKPSRPKARQSMAANVTTDIAALQRSRDAQLAKKKSRGKSIGPGGLEALTETSGNALKVRSPTASMRR
jgi:hypothetical protein